MIQSDFPAHPPFGLCPRVGGLEGADTGEQILLPEEPLPIAAPLTQLDRAGIIRAAAGDKQFHISLLLTGNMVAFDADGIGLSGGCSCCRVWSPQSR